MHDSVGEPDDDCDDRGEGFQHVDGMLLLRSFGNRIWARR